MIFRRWKYLSACQQFRSFWSLKRRNLSQMAASDEVTASVIGTCGVICLNKASKLNALTLPMVDAIKAHLVAMERNEEVQCILVKSSSAKAFCAGGDVQAVTESAQSKEKSDYHRRFFFNEYVMNYLIYSCSKPYVALIHGITMGGGVGLSVHGRFRVATETSLFAMPETAIGLFPDVGGGHFLPNLPGSLGVYLALTGHRLKGYDLVHAGIATHFVSSSSLHSVERDLSNLQMNETTNSFAVVDTILSSHQKQSEDSMHKIPNFSLKDQMETINKTFGQSSVEEIFAMLKVDPSEWALKTVSTMEKFSPRSLKLSLRLLQLGKSLSLEEDLKTEYRVAVGCCELDTDFIEGVRALLVDKDNSPKWSPSGMEDVKTEHLDKFFEPLSNDLDVVAEKKKLFES